MVAFALLRLLYLLTHSMEQSLSWETNWSSASQIPYISWNSKFHYRIHKCPPSWGSSIQSIPLHPTSWRSIIISFHLRLGLPSGLFPSSFHIKTLYTPLLSPIRATCPAQFILDFITRTMLAEEYRSLSSSLCNFLHSPVNLVPFRPKYSPQHPILKYPQPTFIPQCQRPSFTPIRTGD